MINEARQEARENRARLESYEHLYCLQTDPTYLANLIDQMSGNEDTVTVVDRLLANLYNHASTPREEYLFVKLMEAAICEEVETKWLAPGQIGLGATD